MTDPSGPAFYAVVKQRLQEALDLPPASVEAWLVDLARADAGVAAQVRRLLAAHAEAQAGAFLDVSDAGLAPWRGGHAPGTAPGTRIGAFTIERELGHGGMGVVLLATRREGGFIQQVAIKVIPALAHDARAADRLREERRILADLSHPLIAHFVDGGTTADGRPYFAMEYVDGVPITRYCESQRLDLRTRVQLFMRVCEAVSFAHQRLIVRPYHTCASAVSRDPSSTSPSLRIQIRLTSPPIQDFASHRAPGSPCTNCPSS